MELLIHILLFVCLASAITLMGAFYAESEDGPALRSLPRRLGVFLASCVAVAVVMLVLEAVFA